MNMQTDGPYRHQSIDAGIIGRSAVMVKLARTLTKVAASHS